MRSHARMIITFAAVAVLAVACASDKGPAELAIKAAEQAIAEARAEAQKWVPEQLAAVESALTAAKDKFGKGSYKEALAEAQAVAGQAKDLVTAAGTKQAELTKTWEDLNAGLPKMVDAVKSRVDILSKSKKLPADVAKDKFETAKAALAEATQGWQQAQEAFTSGNLTDAITKAQSVKSKAVEALEALGIPVPGAS